jgi:hypothetical protein
MYSIARIKVKRGEVPNSLPLEKLEPNRFYQKVFFDNTIGEDLYFISHLINQEDIDNDYVSKYRPVVCVLGQGPDRNVFQTYEYEIFSEDRFIEIKNIDKLNIELWKVEEDE